MQFVQLQKFLKSKWSPPKMCKTLWRTLAWSRSASSMTFLKSCDRAVAIKSSTKACGPVGLSACLNAPGTSWKSSNFSVFWDQSGISSSGQTNEGGEGMWRYVHLESKEPCVTNAKSASTINLVYTPISRKRPTLPSASLNESTSHSTACPSEMLRCLSK